MIAAKLFDRVEMEMVRRWRELIEMGGQKGLRGTVRAL